MKGTKMFRIKLLLVMLIVAVQVLAQAQLVPMSDEPQASEAVHSPRVFEMGEPPTSETLRLLNEVEQRHGTLKTIYAEFNQEKTSAAFEEVIKSDGNLSIQMPDKLRAVYKDPDESTVWFVNNTLYQMTPALKQVDKYAYRTREEAEQQFRLMMLGFGMSSKEILQNYEVLQQEDKDQKTGKSQKLLIFRPLDPDVSRTYKDFRVWLNDQMLPEKVKYEEVSGDVTLLTIRKLVKDDPIKAKVFEPVVPKDYDVIEH